LVCFRFCEERKELKKKKEEGEGEGGKEKQNKTIKST
jgi:hypothetical protein